MLSSTRTLTPGSECVCVCVCVECFDVCLQIIRELREEVDKLRAMLSGSSGKEGGGISAKEVDELKDKLKISESLMAGMTMTWEQKLLETEKIHRVSVLQCVSSAVSVGACGVCVCVGEAEGTGGHGHIGAGLWHRSAGGQVLPGQPQRRPNPQRAAGLLPQGAHGPASPAHTLPLCVSPGEDQDWASRCGPTPGHPAARAGDR